MPNRAPAPTRTTTDFTIMLGLLPVKVRLLAPTQDVDLVTRKMFTKDGHSVGMPYTDLETGERVSRDEIVKMVPVGEDFIELTDDEIASVTAGQAVDKGCVPVETFIPLEALGVVYKTRAWYQARPTQREVGSGKKKKRQDDPAASKVFALLLRTMQEEGVAALVRVGLRSAARYGALLPDGTFHFLHYDEEVREDLALPEAEFSDAELDMARTLIQSIGTSTPPLHNDAADAIQEYIAAKLAGDVEEFVLEEAPSIDNVLDLTAMLQASVAAAKGEARAS